MLRGFAADDMRQLIRSNLGRVTNSDMATQIAEFFLRTVKGLDETSQITIHSVTFGDGLYVAKIEASNLKNAGSLNFAVTISPEGQINSVAEGTN